MGAWRNYLAPGSKRDFMIASTMGLVHFMAQIPYGIGAYYLDRAGRADLGTTVGWGANIGMALAAGEWRGVAKGTVRTLQAAIAILILAIITLAYANSLQTN